MMSLLTILLAGLLAFQSADDDPEPPRPGPVAVKLVAKKTTFKLDLKGMTLDEFKKAARTGKVAPIRPDMEMVITNTSKRPMRVRTAGSATPRITFTLTGPGVFESSSVRVEKMKGPKKGSTLVVLKPGEKASIPVETLTNQIASTSGKHLYFTEPGEYRLEASVRTAFYLEYEGPGQPGQITYLVPKAPAIKIKVEK